MLTPMPFELLGGERQRGERLDADEAVERPAPALPHDPADIPHARVALVPAHELLVCAFDEQA
jgi:hypothetical protein